jgi:glycosyltransferase involved in cell wall biosynthesis
MRILLVKSFPQLTVTAELAKGLKYLGHKVEIAVPKIDESAKQMIELGIPVFVVDIRSSLKTNNCIKKRLLDIKGIVDLSKLYKTGNYDIIHLNLLRARFLGRVAHLLAKNSPIVSTIHGPDLDNTFYYALEKSTYWVDDGTAVVSKDVLNYVLDKGIKYKKIEVIYNGIDIEKFDKIPVKKWYLYDELKIPRSIKLVGMVAWLYPNNIKGHEDFLKAAKIILDEKKDIRFVIVGGNPYRQYNYKEQLINLAKNLGIERYVYLLGTRYDIPNILDSLACLVLPSRVREGFGIVLIEAMARRIPTIGTDVGGIPEVVENGKTGVIVPPADTSSLAEAILKLISDPAKVITMGILGRERVERIFTVEIMAKNYEKFYEKILNKK